MSWSHLEQAREVLLRAKKSIQSPPEDSINSNGRVRGHKVAGTYLHQLTTAPIEATKKYEIIGGSAPNTSHPASATKRAKGPGGIGEKLCCTPL
jgi:hypothetical protein